MTEKYVSVGSTRTHIYHTNPECDNAGRELRRAHSGEVTSEWSECKLCERGYEPYEREGPSLSQRIQSGDVVIDD